MKKLYLKYKKKYLALKGGDSIRLNKIGNDLLLDVERNSNGKKVESVQVNRIGNDLVLDIKSDNHKKKKQATSSSSGVITAPVASGIVQELIEEEEEEKKEEEIVAQTRQSTIPALRIAQAILPKYPKSEHNRTTVTITGSSGSYNGAGCIFITRTHDNSEPIIILYHNGRNRTYEDTGGSIERGDTARDNPILYCACRETYEETNTYLLPTFNIGEQINGRNIFVNHQNYRGYFVGLPPGSFNHKLAEEHLTDEPLQGEIKETNGVIYVQLTDFINALSLNRGGDLRGVTGFKSNGKREKITILGKTKALIREAYSRGIITLVAHNPKSIIETTVFKENNSRGRVTRKQLIF